MLTTELVNEIDRLLREGELSQRKIADHLCVSRGTISAIASGRRGLYGREPLDVYSPLVPSSPPTRCPHCGYRVYLPCLICLARQHQQRQRYLRLIMAEICRNDVTRENEHSSFVLRHSSFPPTSAPRTPNAQSPAR